MDEVERGMKVYYRDFKKNLFNINIRENLMWTFLFIVLSVGVVWQSEILLLYLIGVILLWRKA